MKDLNKKAFLGLIGFILMLAALLFIPTWNIYYWQAWVFLGVFSVSILAITLYLMKKDPKLLASRMSVGASAEKEQSQKIIQLYASIIFTALFLLSAFDYRFGWSAVPLHAVIIGNILVVLGLLIIFFVFKENSFTSAIIEISKNQKIITTGPYAIIRHPMYLGALIMIFGIPIALGSWWGLITCVALTITIVIRLREEEKFLIKNLNGYTTYQKKVKYKLIPFIW